MHARGCALDWQRSILYYYYTTTTMTLRHIIILYAVVPRVNINYLLQMIKWYNIMFYYILYPYTHIRNILRPADRICFLRHLPIYVRNQRHDEGYTQTDFRRHNIDIDGHQRRGLQTSGTIRSFPWSIIIII